MRAYLISKKLILLSGVIFLILSSCSDKIYPPTMEYVFFDVDGKSMQIRVAPFINAMPGAQSNDVVVPISFYMENSEQHEEWPRKFRLTKVRISRVNEMHTGIDKLDHNSWMHNTQEERDGNALRISRDIMPHTFDVSIWFKDNKGKRYRVKFNRAYAGKVF